MGRECAVSGQPAHANGRPAALAGRKRMKGNAFGKRCAAGCVYAHKALFIRTDKFRNELSETLARQSSAISDEHALVDRASKSF